MTPTDGPTHVSAVTRSAISGRSGPGLGSRAIAAAIRPAAQLWSFPCASSHERLSRLNLIAKSDEHFQADRMIDLLPQGLASATEIDDHIPNASVSMRQQNPTGRRETTLSGAPAAAYSDHRPGPRPSRRISLVPDHCTDDREETLRPARDCRQGSSIRESPRPRRARAAGGPRGPGPTGIRSLRRLRPRFRPTVRWAGSCRSGGPSSVLPSWRRWQPSIGPESGQTAWSS